MTKYLNTDFELSEERDEEIMLQLEIENRNGEIFFSFATLCSFFEEELIKTINREYPGEKTRVIFSSNLPLDFYSFREFKKIVFN